MRKKLFITPFLLPLAVLLIFGMRLCASADETVKIDYERKCSVSVHLSDGENVSQGAQIAAYFIAEVYDDNGKMNFKYTDSFKSCCSGVEQAEIKASAEKLLDHAADVGAVPVSVKTTDGDGRLVFTDLRAGVYLIAQTRSVAGFSDCLPFLVTLPEIENGIISYDVDASPKTQIEKYVDITVKKVWNDDKEEHEAIKIMLYKGSKIQGESVELSEKNSWEHTWRNVPQSDVYSVKEVDIPLGYYATYKRSGNSFIVTNSAELIKTGQQKALIPVFAVSGAFIFLTGLIKSYAGKDEKEE